MILLWILGIIAFIAAIMISVGLHEAGHMITAKKLGVPVPRFFIGFGPTIFSFKRGNTEYGLKALPLGGFVQIDDDRQPEGSPERALLSYVTPWKRIAIFIAGPLVNLALGVVIIFNLLYFTPIKAVTPQLSKINSCSVEPSNCQASKSGLKPGDTIVKINGHSISNVVDENFIFSDKGDDIIVRRGNDFKAIHVNANKDHKIGVTLSVKDQSRGASESAKTIGQLFTDSFNSLSKIPGQVPHIFNSILGNEKRSQESMSSVVGVGRTYGETVSSNKISNDNKITYLIYYSGALNLGLGFANLLPLLPLDGGRIFIALIDMVKIRLDKIRKKSYIPTSFKTVNTMTIIMGAIVFSFMGLLIIADIVAPIKMY